MMLAENQKKVCVHAHDVYFMWACLFFSLPSRVECFQRVNFAIPPHGLPALAFYILPFVYSGYVQPNEANVRRFPASTRQQIVWHMLEMWLYARRMIERLIMSEVCEGFWVLFELWSC